MEYAEINGFQLDIETIEDSFEKSIAKYEFPYRDGALLEDMGQKAHVIKIRCFFFEERYEEHFDFLNSLNELELIDFFHPKYGLIQGHIEALNVRHDDRLRTAEIDITFVENLRGEIEPKQYIEIEQGIEEDFIEGQDELIDEFIQDTEEELGSESQEILSEEIDPEKSILEQFSGISERAYQYLKQVDSYVRELDSTLNAISNPANSLISVINYGTTLPARVIYSLARAVERYAVLYNSLKFSPYKFLKSLRDGLTSLENAFKRFSKYTKKASVQRQCLELAYIYKEDQKKRQRAKSLEKIKSFDALGNYIKLDTTENIMTVETLEQTLAFVRQQIQEVIDESRSMQSMKEMAKKLMVYVNDIKIEREKIITVTTDNVLPLHLICLMHGLPYKSAERVYAINKIRNPNFVPAGQVKIYAR